MEEENAVQDARVVVMTKTKTATTAAMNTEAQVLTITC
jgi:hypothetical protein